MLNFAALGFTGEEAAIASAWDRSASVGLPISYLVNNAGPASTTDLTVMEGLQRSVGSYVAVTDQWLGRWGAQAKSVTFTASIAGNYVAGATRDWYPTGKAAIAGYTRHLAVKHRGAPRSNAVAPGGIATQRTAEAFATPALKARIERQPMQRPGSPDEIAAVICFLLACRLLCEWRGSSDRRWRDALDVVEAPSTLPCRGTAEAVRGRRIGNAPGPRAGRARPTSHRLRRRVVG